MGNLDLVKLLVRCGADPLAELGENTPAEVAADMGHTHIAQYLQGGQSAAACGACPEHVGPARSMWGLPGACGACPEHVGPARSMWGLPGACGACPEHVGPARSMWGLPGACGACPEHVGPARSHFLIGNRSLLQTHGLRYYI